MSFEVTTAFVQQFRDNVRMLAQQKGSKLRATMTVQEDVTGEKAFFEQIGATAAVEVTSRHGDSPLISTPHDRRMVTLIDVEWGDLIDNRDRVRLLIDPTNPYAVNAGWAIGRKIDDLIIEKFFADAKTGKDGSTTTSFDSTNNEIALDFAIGGGGSNSGLTIGKLLEARRILLNNEVDPDMDTFNIAVTSRQLQDLLNTDQITSADFNTVRALTTGEVDSFLGFRFHQIERLATDPSASTTRWVPFWASSGMALAIGAEPRARIVERADKRFSTYVYWSGTFGATRLEEAKVGRILCDES